MFMRTVARTALLALPLVLIPAATAFAQEADPVAGVEAADPVVEAADPAAARDVEMTPDEVQAYQRALKQLGYFHGPADGRKGPRTRLALRNFQRDQELAASGSFDAETVARIDDQARIARLSERPAPRPVAARAPAAPSGGGGGGDVVSAVKVGAGAVGTAGRATGKAVGTAGVASGKAVGTAGVATGKAGATAGKAVATAGVATAKASVVAARAVANAPVYVYKQGRRFVVGDSRSSDEQIRRAILSQYADDERLVPDEIDVEVLDGNVTLALPEGARSDAAHATRLARLTPNVRSVTTIYVDVVAPAPDTEAEP